jgi:hypothetical protein
MKSLTWNQVNAWRLAQHGLMPRLKREAFVEVASRLYGIHAQVMSAAELALGARTDGLTPQDVQTALWQDRSLVKTWAMRGTLHLLAADDVPLHTAARTIDPLGWINFESYGISQKQREAFLEAVPEILGDEPMTREQLAAAVTERVGLPVLGELIASVGWGSPLKPSAFRGDLCFGPNQGKNVTFVNPKKWLRKWEPVEPEAAFREIARRYLRAYGPLTPKHFARWWNEGWVNVAKKVFQQIEDELETVDVEGWQALALRSTVEPMQEAAVSGVVRLLPLFDAYVLDIGRTVSRFCQSSIGSRSFASRDGQQRLCLSMGLSGASGIIRRQGRRQRSRWNCLTRPQSTSRRASKQKQPGWERSSIQPLCGNTARLNNPIGKAHRVLNAPHFISF